MDMSDFAKNLRRLRKEKKMSQVELGGLLNYGYTAISNYESGRNEPSLDDLIRLADIFDVSIDELLGTARLHKNRTVYQFFCNMNQKQRDLVLEVLHIFFKDTI